MTMAKVFTPLVRDGIDPERKSILLEDFLAWLLDRAEDNLADVKGTGGSKNTDNAAAAQGLILETIEQFLNDRASLGMSS